MEVLFSNTIFCIFAFGCLGAIFGSFISAMSYRFAMQWSMKDIIFKRSMCTNCKKTLDVFSLIPIFSYLFYRGKCRFCGQKIGLYYLFLELFCCLCFIGIYIFFANNILKAFFLSSLFVVLLIAIIVDIKAFYIPDTIQVSLLFLLLIWLFLLNNYNFVPIIHSLTLAILIFILGLLVSYFKKANSLGFGDVKLFFILGGFLDWKIFSYWIFLAGVFGILTHILQKYYYYFYFQNNNKVYEFPFAPAIIVAFVIFFLTN